jgi:hypothetical protein
MDELLSLLKGVAPALATAVAGPLGGAAVSAIAGKFGVTDSVEAVAKAIAGDPQAAQKLADLELEYAKLDAADRDSARKMQIVALQQENWFAKNFLYLFTSLWSLFAMVYFSFVTFGTIADSGIRMADTILGVLIGTVLTGFFNFFFGSSKGSKDKTDALVKGMNNVQN